MKQFGYMMREDRSMDGGQKRQKWSEREREDEDNKVLKDDDK